MSTKKEIEEYKKQLEREKAKVVWVKLIGLEQQDWDEWGDFKETFAYQVPNITKIGTMGIFPLKNEFYEGVVIEEADFDEMSKLDWFPRGMRRCYLMGY